MKTKGLVAGTTTTTLLLKLLLEEDMYGYQMIETLKVRSDDTFALKAGTLYPILHGLERNGVLTSYEESSICDRMRKYYRITTKGRLLLQDKEAEWQAYQTAVNQILNYNPTK